jgi:tetratricopeptide (TPR) repeat protein
MMLVLLLFSLSTVDAQQHDTHAAAAVRPATLMPGMGRLHHPIATKSAEAQRFFDQGLTLVYAFNHDEAVRSFRRAAELDPASPMPHWGVALALGPLADAWVARAKRDEVAAIDAWRSAVLAEDKLNYDEPADWFYPTRESLGAALLRAKRYDEAERVFRDDLTRNPRNGRSLFGLWQTLAMTKKESASAAEKQFRDAWKHADVTLRLVDY